MSVEWRVSKEFTAESGIVARVTVLELHQPKYSIEVGVPVMGKPGLLSRHFSEEQALDACDVICSAASYVSDKMEEHAKSEEERLRKEREKRERHRSNVEKRKEENRKRVNGGRK